MKYFLFLLIFTCYYSQAQVEPIGEHSGVAVAMKEVHVRPEFPGGPKALYKKIMQNMWVPNSKEPFTAIINVSFVIDEEGNLTDIKLLRDSNNLGYRVIKAIAGVKEKWIPGTINGKPVKAGYTLPVTINVE